MTEIRPRRPQATFLGFLNSTSPDECSKRCRGYLQLLNFTSTPNTIDVFDLIVEDLFGCSDSTARAVRLWGDYWLPTLIVYCCSIEVFMYEARIPMGLTGAIPRTGRPLSRPLLLSVKPLGR